MRAPLASMMRLALLKSRAYRNAQGWAYRKSESSATTTFALEKSHSPSDAPRLSRFNGSQMHQRAAGNFWNTSVDWADSVGELIASVRIRSVAPPPGFTDPSATFSAFQKSSSVLIPPPVVTV